MVRHRRLATTTSVPRPSSSDSDTSSEGDRRSVAHQIGLYLESGSVPKKFLENLGAIAKKLDTIREEFEAECCKLEAFILEEKSRLSQVAGFYPESKKAGTIKKLEEYVSALENADDELRRDVEALVKHVETYEELCRMCGRL